MDVMIATHVKHSLNRGNLVISVRVRDVPLYYLRSVKGTAITRKTSKMEITLNTGCAGDSHKCNIDWFDENNVRRKTIVEVNIQPQDKPRTLEIIVNGVIVATVRDGGAEVEDECNLCGIKRASCDKCEWTGENGKSLGLAQ